MSNNILIDSGIRVGDFLTSILSAGREHGIPNMSCDIFDNEEKNIKIKDVILPKSAWAGYLFGLFTTCAWEQNGNHLRIHMPDNMFVIDFFSKYFSLTKYNNHQRVSNSKNRSRKYYISIYGMINLFKLHCPNLKIQDGKKVISYGKMLKSLPDNPTEKDEENHLRYSFYRNNLKKRILSYSLNVKIFEEYFERAENGHLIDSIAADMTDCKIITPKIISDKFDKLGIFVSEIRATYICAILSSPINCSIKSPFSGNRINKRKEKNSTVFLTKEICPWLEQNIEIIRSESAYIGKADRSKSGSKPSVSIRRDILQKRTTDNVLFSGDKSCIYCCKEIGLACANEILNGALYRACSDIKETELWIPFGEDLTKMATSSMHTPSQWQVYLCDNDMPKIQWHHFFTKDSIKHKTQIDFPYNDSAWIFPLLNVDHNKLKDLTEKEQVEFFIKNEWKTKEEMEKICYDVYKRVVDIENEKFLGTRKASSYIYEQLCQWIHIEQEK